MNRISFEINGIPVECEKGTTVLEAARAAGIRVPTLCYFSDLFPQGRCRVCSVEIEGRRGMVTSCTENAADGMKVRTNTSKVRRVRKTIVEMLLAAHRTDCPSCVRNGNCELQQVARELGISGEMFEKDIPYLPIDESNPAIVRDPSKCIKCGRCVQVCGQVQGTSVIEFNGRGADISVSPPLGKSLAEAKCTFCGQCINVCPVGAIYEKSSIEQVWDLLEDPGYHVVVQTAPSVRVSLGEELGMPPGSIVTGKMVSFLKHIGFDKVYDTNFAADLTIMEEGHELLERIENGGVLPMFTSCSPGWINYIETRYPELLPNVSTCKSPQQMFGAVAKTYYAEKEGIPPEKIKVVSVMPCTAKKAEAVRSAMGRNGIPDVDYVLTTRELGKMVIQSGLDFMKLSDAEYDAPMGESTGAAVIFGAAGGVAEAALRTVYTLTEGHKPEKTEFTALRGHEGIRETEVTLGGRTVRAAAAYGLKNAEKIIKDILEGRSSYHFIEIMACPDGCIGGGGQPLNGDAKVREERRRGLYENDRSAGIRYSHENSSVARLYSEYLGRPLGEKSHRLLHTGYNDRK